MITKGLLFLLLIRSLQRDRQIPETDRWYNFLLIFSIFPESHWLKIDSTPIPDQQEAEIAEYKRPDILLLSCQNCACLQIIKELEQRVSELEKMLSEDR